MRASVDRAIQAGSTSGLSPAEIAWCANQYITDKHRELRRSESLKVERSASSQTITYERGPLDKPSGYMAAVSSIVDQAIASYAKNLDVDWSAIAQVEIAMPDGQLTTWGQATLQQHQARYAMLRANAEKNLEAAARHLLAIQELESTGAHALAA